MIHVSTGRPELPDAGGGLCCAGAAFRGPAYCTCWEPVCDMRQAPIDEKQLQRIESAEEEIPVRLRSCADCAYRAGSPERRGDPRYKNSEAGALYGLPMIRGGARFFCHVGVRRIIGWAHPSGVYVEAPPDHYFPPIAPHSGLPFKADGSPMDLCAGFVALAHGRASVVGSAGQIRTGAETDAMRER